MAKFRVEIEDTISQKEVDPCPDCKRLHISGLTCDAFPESIPIEIRRGEHQHREPFPGDSGLTFIPKPPDGA